MSEQKLDAVPLNPLWERNHESLTEANFIIGNNPIETFSRVSSVLAFFSDVHHLQHPDRPEKFTYDGHSGYWICIQSLRAAIEAQVEPMRSVARQRKEERS